MVTAFVVATSCKNDGLDSNSKSYSEELYGTWTWVESCGGFAGIKYTPATEGYTSAIEFNSSGIFRKYKNEQLETVSKFTVTTGKSIYTLESVNVIEYEGDFIKQSVEFFGKDTLILRDECYDCFVHAYVKK